MFIFAVPLAPFLKPFTAAPITLNVIAEKHIDTAGLTVAFQDYFYNTTSLTYDVVSGLAAQLVGPAAAIEVAYITSFQLFTVISPKVPQSSKLLSSKVSDTLDTYSWREYNKLIQVS